MLDTDNLNSAFVVLTYCSITDSQTQEFIKNLLKAWNCLLLQALLQELLFKYLSLDIKIFDIVGLNIAFFLHQSFVDNNEKESQADFSQFEFSSDTLICEWFWQTRASYTELHFTDDLAVHKWYTFKKLALPQVTKQWSLRKAIEGYSVKIRYYPCSVKASCAIRNFCFFIHHLTIKFCAEDIVLMRFMLSEDTSHL